MTEIENNILGYLHRNDGASAECTDTTYNIVREVQRTLVSDYEIELALASLKERGYVKAIPRLLSQDDVYRAQLEWKATDHESRTEVPTEVVHYKK